MQTTSKTITRAGRLGLLAVAAAAITTVAGPARAQLSPLALASEVALDDLDKHSRGIFVGTATAIDESAVRTLKSDDPNYAGALTTVTFAIEEVIAGTFSGAQIDIVLRGGNRLDGLVESWSNAPDFAVGEKYLISLKNEDYTVSPLVPGFAGVLRFDTASGTPILVDADGNSVTVDASGKLTRVKRVASSMAALRKKQRAEEQVSASIDVSDHPLDFPTPSTVDVTQVDKAPDLIEKLKQTVKQNAGSRKATAAMAKLSPRPLDNKLSNAR
jgi:hypothetical protein